MQAIISYFKRSEADCILLLTSIAVAVRVYKENPFVSAVLFLFCLYIIGTIIRIGQASDIMNGQITNPIVRARLGLGVRPGSIIVSKKTVFKKIAHIIFWLGFVAILTAFIFGL